MNQIMKHNPKGSKSTKSTGSSTAQQQLVAPKVKFEEEKTKETNRMSDESSPKTFIKSTTGSTFVKENTGNIKDYYKISSCIGRGKFENHGNFRKMTVQNSKQIQHENLPFFRLASFA